MNERPVLEGAVSLVNDVHGPETVAAGRERNNRFDSEAAADVQWFGSEGIILPKAVTRWMSVIGIQGEVIATNFATLSASVSCAFDKWRTMLF